MLGRPRRGPAEAALAASLAELATLFTAAGATPIDLPHLFLGDTLLDLYGEDLRARAFLFPDAERGNELCLRPDFTVPVALAHGAEGWDRTTSYAYQGPVFRRQPQGQGRPVEFVQAGVERFGDPDPVAAEVDVFRVLFQGLQKLGINAPRVTMGDLSIPFALIDAMETPGGSSGALNRRRAGLRRHFWRPAKFQALLDRAVSPPRMSDALSLASASMGSPARLDQMIRDAGGAVGLRTADAVIARLAQLSDDASLAPLPKAEAELLRTVLAVSGPAVSALSQLRGLSGPAGLQIAVDRLEARLEALASAGFDPSMLEYDANFGRNLEYYDGFVFEMRAQGTGLHPPLAGGGRYDAMTTELGASAAVPAVGGMIRPEAVLEVLG